MSKPNTVFMRRTVLKALAYSGVLMAFVQNAQAQSTVKIGAILPLTGQTATFGQESANGLKLALETLGKEGGSKIELIIEDTQGSTKGAAAAINKLITSDKVNAVIGEVASSNTIAASGAANDAKIPLMTHASTNDSITIGKDFVSRICFVDSFQGQVMAKFALTTLKAKTAFIMWDSDSDYSKGLKTSFEKAFAAGGGKVLGNVSFSSKDTDFAAQLSKVKRSSSDVVFLPGYYQQAGAVLKQATELKVKGKFLGTDGWDSPDLFKIAGKAVAGTYMSTHFAPDDTDAKVQSFVKEYEAKYKARPGAMAALGYDAGLVINDALKRANSTDPTKIRDAINSTKNFTGITGTITLDSNRNAVKPAVILEATESTWKFNSRVNP